MTLGELLDSLNGIHGALPDGEHTEVVLRCERGDHEPSVEINIKDDGTYVMILE